jgi:hypothetical protein
MYFFAAEAEIKGSINLIEPFHQMIERRIPELGGHSAGGDAAVQGVIFIIE